MHMEREDRAEALFREGYNCAQSVVCAFADEAGLDMEKAASLASSFGGGMGRLREVCGAVSGALLVLGMLQGYSDPKDETAKRDHYHRVQEFARRFREQNGSIICRELLAGSNAVPGPDPQPRTEAFYRDRPCARLIRSGAAILEEMLTEEETPADGSSR